MDETKEFILQCKKALKIQKLRHEGLWQAGDFYTCYKHEKVFVWGGEGEDEPYDSGNPTWLPRQDQLQEMVKTHWRQMLLTFWIWHTQSESGKSQVYTSMEQLWLAFVMKEKYNKIWNGKDWIKI